ncbi:hypothetical protein CP09DC79_1185A, partial [Chlamydia psittaci 09DC79]
MESCDTLPSFILGSV